MNPVSSACMHIHIYMGGGGSYDFHQSFVIPRTALIDGTQPLCTGLDGGTLVDGGLKRFLN